MKFLIDVSASGTLAQWLIDSGHDVVQVVEQRLGWIQRPSMNVLKRGLWGMIQISSNGRALRTIPASSAADSPSGTGALRGLTIHTEGLGVRDNEEV